MVRRYDDPCGLARALNMVGERWALLIVRELLLGSKRFSDLRGGLPGISPNVLSQRLTELADRGIIEKRQLGPPTSAHAYRLTDLGHELEQALMALARWGRRAQSPGGGDLSTDALLLAMRTTADASRDCPRGPYVLVLGNDVVAVHVSDEGLTMERRLPDQPIATVSADPSVLRAVLFGGRDLHDAVEAGEAAVTGNRKAANAFFTLFGRPSLIQR